MRNKLKASLNYRLDVLKPEGGGNGKRKGFALQKRFLDPSHTPKVERIDHVTLTSINDNFFRGRIGTEEAHKNVLELREQIYKAQGALSAVVFNQENLKLLDQYWTSEYEERGRDLIDEKTARYELERAVESLGMLSIHSATRKELQDQVNKLHKGNKQRRVVSKLNVLLRFAGRSEIKLIKARKEKPPVKYLTRADFALFTEALEKLPLDATLRNAYSLLHQTAFSSGTRIGEAFAIDAIHINEKLHQISILTQIDRKNSQRQTKNRTERQSFILPGGLNAIKDWVKVKSEIDTQKRLHITDNITRKVCQQLWPHETKKHLRFHDLRHCYAIALLSKGVSLSHVAQMIGDSIAVCEEHYIGFIITTDAMEMVRSRMLKK